MSAEGRGHGEPDSAGTKSQVAILSDEAVGAHAGHSGGGGDDGLRPTLDSAKATRIDQAPAAGEGSDVGPTTMPLGRSVTPGELPEGYRKVVHATTSVE